MTDELQVDRNEHFFRVEGLHFPHWEKPDTPLVDTVLDGELVIDIDPSTKEVSRPRGRMTAVSSLIKTARAALLRI